MSLSRPTVKEILSEAGVSSENMDRAIQKIIDGHTATVDALKEKIENAENNSETIKKMKVDVEKYKNELETAKRTIADGEKYKEMYENQKAEYDKYKGDVTAKETKAAKEKAIREYFKSKGINDDNMSIAMRGIKSEIDAAELDEKGKIKDIKVFDDLLKGDYSKLVSRVETRGADTQIPPPNANGKVTKTKAEIMAIKDASERIQAIKDNPDAFGINTKGE